MFVPVRQITTPEEDVNQVHTAPWDHQPPSTVQLDGTVMIMNWAHLKVLIFIFLDMQSSNKCFSINLSILE
jgi:hypothetical protein